MAEYKYLVSFQNEYGDEAWAEWYMEFSNAQRIADSMGLIAVLVTSDL